MKVTLEETYGQKRFNFPVLLGLPMEATSKTFNLSSQKELQRSSIKSNMNEPVATTVVMEPTNPYTSAGLGPC